MVAVADFVEEYCGAAAQSSSRVKRTFWGFLIQGETPEEIMKPLIRMLGIISGTAFIFAFVGLWTLPGSSVDGDILPFKLALSAFWLLLGAFLIQLCQERGRLELEVDKLRQEMRAVERGKDGMSKLVNVMPFHEISEIVIEDGMMVIYAEDGHEAARFPLRDRARGKQKQAA